MLLSNTFSTPKTVLPIRISELRTRLEMAANLINPGLKTTLVDLNRILLFWNDKFCFESQLKRQIHVYLQELKFGMFRDQEMADRD